MPVEPRKVDQSAVLAARANQLVASRGEFTKQADAELESFVKEQRDLTASYGPNLNALGKAMTERQVPKEELYATLYNIGVQVAMQGIPAGFFRPSVSRFVTELLTQGNEALDAVAGQMKQSLQPPHEPHTAEQALELEHKKLEEAGKTIDDVAQSVSERQGLTLDEAKKKVEEYFSARAQQHAASDVEGFEAAKKEIARVKATVGAQDAAFASNNVPEEEKLGTLVANGYQDGVEKLKEEMANNPFAQLFGGGGGGNVMVLK